MKSVRDDQHQDDHLERISALPVVQAPVDFENRSTPPTRIICGPVTLTIPGTEHTPLRVASRVPPNSEEFRKRSEEAVLYVDRKDNPDKYSAATTTVANGNASVNATAQPDVFESNQVAKIADVVESHSDDKATPIDNADCNAFAESRSYADETQLQTYEHPRDRNVEFDSQHQSTIRYNSQLLTGGTSASWPHRYDKTYSPGNPNLRDESISYASEKTSFVADEQYVNYNQLYVNCNQSYATENQSYSTDNQNYATNNQRYVNGNEEHLQNDMQSYQQNQYVQQCPKDYSGYNMSYKHNNGEVYAHNNEQRYNHNNEDTGPGTLYENEEQIYFDPIYGCQNNQFENPYNQFGHNFNRNNLNSNQIYQQQFYSGISENSYQSNVLNKPFASPPFNKLIEHPKHVIKYTIPKKPTPKTYMVKNPTMKAPIPKNTDLKSTSPKIQPTETSSKNFHQKPFYHKYFPLKNSPRIQHNFPKNSAAKSSNNKQWPSNVNNKNINNNGNNNNNNNSTTYKESRVFNNDIKTNSIDIKNQAKVNKNIAIQTKQQSNIKDYTTNNRNYYKSVHNKDITNTCNTIACISKNPNDVTMKCDQNRKQQRRPDQALFVPQQELLLLEKARCHDLRVNASTDCDPSTLPTPSCLESNRSMALTTSPNNQTPMSSASPPCEYIPMTQPSEPILTVDIPLKKTIETSSSENKSSSSSLFRNIQKNDLEMSTIYPLARPIVNSFASPVSSQLSISESYPLATSSNLNTPVVSPISSKHLNTPSTSPATTISPSNPKPLQQDFTITDKNRISPSPLPQPHTPTSYPINSTQRNATDTNNISTSNPETPHPCPTNSPKLNVPNTSPITSPRPIPRNSIQLNGPSTSTNTLKLRALRKPGLQHYRATGSNYNKKTSKISETQSESSDIVTLV